MRVDESLSASAFSRRANAVAAVRIAEVAAAFTRVVYDCSRKNQSDANPITNTSTMLRIIFRRMDILESLLRVK